MWRPKRRVHRAMPYYKVQVYDEAGRYWSDERGAFGEVQEARDYVQEKLGSKTTRIVVVQEQGRFVLGSEGNGRESA
jgi:hypothetical protein